MTYITSDIHGDFEKYKKLLDTINISDNDTLYILGDVIDRGEYGIEILLDTMKKKNIILIKGNHELMMENVLKRKIKNYEYEILLFLWESNGGEKTFYDYKNLNFFLKIKLFNYLKNLPLFLNIEVNEKKYHLVHGYPALFSEKTYNFLNKNKIKPISYEESIVWKRVEKEDIFFMDKTVIFGHTITKYYDISEPLSIFKSFNKIALDCGCALKNNKGRLGCLCLDDMKEIYI